MKKIKSKETNDRINFYDKLHKESTNYNEMLQLCEKRIKLHRRIESCSTLLNNNANYFVDEEDTLSHFLCRLLCAQSIYSKNWFVNAEVQLFKINLNEMEEISVENYFRNIFFYKISGVEDNKINSESQFEPKIKNKLRFNENLKVHFSKVLELVATRKVELLDGFCEATPSTFISIMSNFYRTYLETKMDALIEHFNTNPDERFIKLHARVFSTPKTEATAGIASVLALLPPCMHGIYKKLRIKKHLKNNDRQTISLFLKESGVGVDETIMFLRSHFEMPKEAFDREHVYSIRHNYGLEGKRSNYSCFGCKKIIGMGGDGNSYGCPFKSNINDVKSYLNEYDISMPELEELVNKFEYQTACNTLLSKLIKTEKEHISTPAEFHKKWREADEEKSKL